MHTLNVSWPRGMTALSNYAENLPSEAKQRYQNKLVLIGGVDPFCIIGKDYRESSFPPVDASDLLSTLVTLGR